MVDLGPRGSKMVPIEINLVPHSCSTSIHNIDLSCTVYTTWQTDSQIDRQTDRAMAIIGRLSYSIGGLKILEFGHRMAAMPTIGADCWPIESIGRFDYTSLSLAAGFSRRSKNTF